MRAGGIVKVGSAQARLGILTAGQPGGQSSLGCFACGRNCKSWERPGVGGDLRNCVKSIRDGAKLSEIYKETRAALVGQPRGILLLPNCGATGGAQIQLYAPDQQIAILPTKTLDGLTSKIQPTFFERFPARTPIAWPRNLDGRPAGWAEFIRVFCVLAELEKLGAPRRRW